MDRSAPPPLGKFIPSVTSCFGRNHLFVFHAYTLVRNWRIRTRTQIHEWHSFILRCTYICPYFKVYWPCSHVRWINFSSRVTGALSDRQAEISQARVKVYLMVPSLPKRVNTDDFFVPPFNRIWPEIVVVCFILKQGIADHFLLLTGKYYNQHGNILLKINLKSWGRNNESFVKDWVCEILNCSAQVLCMSLRLSLGNTK